MGALLSGLGLAKTNHLVLFHITIGRPLNRLILRDSVHGVVLQAPDEIPLIIRPMPKQFMVVLALVIHDDRPRQKC